ncbi:MAG: DUF1598 domain-containing protein [Pirellulaceae bacterium]
MLLHRRLGFPMIAFFIVVGLATSYASDDIRSKFSKHLAAGEFKQATSLASSVAPEDRHRMLRQVAQAQIASGNIPAGPGLSPTDYGAYQNNRSSSGSVSFEASGGGMPGAAGGAAIADFDSLMELIQATIVPDTWEALGGPSTMSPYPAGVFVDAQGMLREPEVAPNPATLDALREQLVQPTSSGSGNWLEPSAMRKVSLARLQEALMQRQFQSLPPTSTMASLAGLSNIEYVFLTEEGDVILAGPVSGIRWDATGLALDARTGRAALRLDALAFALQAAVRQQTFGCTIEPTQQGIVQAQQVVANIQSGQLAAAAASSKLRAALGPQEVQVFGTAANNPIAMLMVEADRHMKMVALGDKPMPRGVANYLDIVEGTIDQGPLTGTFLRMWFAPNPLSVRCDAAKRSFQLAGLPLKLLTEQENADLQGERFAAPTDIRAKKLAETFNRHFVDIAREYPIYDQLRGLYQLTAVAQIIATYGAPSGNAFDFDDLSQAALIQSQPMPTMKQTESLVVHRRFRKGSTIHSVVVASGGVHVAPKELVSSSLEVYPTLTSVAATQQQLPRRIDRWWWD